MNGKVRIAVAGAGLIGRRHVEEVDASPVATLAAIVDPGPVGPELAQKYGVPLYTGITELFAAGRPDGVILATPNRMHVDGGLECVAAGVPVIVEKPVGDTVEGATRLVEAGEAAGGGRVGRPPPHQPPPPGHGPPDRGGRAAPPPRP